MDNLQEKLPLAAVGELKLPDRPLAENVLPVIGAEAEPVVVELDGHP